MKNKGFFFNFDIIVNVLAPSAAFEYLCYGSMNIINIFTLTVKVTT